jgi:hypothetical protein
VTIKHLKLSHAAIFQVTPPPTGDRCLRIFTRHITDQAYGFSFVGAEPYHKLQEQIMYPRVYVWKNLQFVVWLNSVVVPFMQWNREEYPCQSTKEIL